MAQLVEEVKQWNTPVIGAYVLWEFTKGYTENHSTGDAPVALLHFLANAILTNQKLSLHISDRRDNLQSYVRSFEENNNADILLGIQSRVRQKFSYTFASIDIAVAEGLLVWDKETGKLHHRNITKAPKRGNNLKEAIKREGMKAKILGRWFSQHDISTIANFLKVVF